MKEKLARWITLLVLGVLAFTIFYGVFLSPGSGPDMGYGLLFDGIFFSLLTVLLYLNYEEFNLDLLSYGGIMFLILFHLGGAFWWYGKNIGVVQFDMIIHAVAGVVLSIFFYRYVTKRVSFENRFKLWVLLVLLVLGLSGIHEILEFFGYNFLGEGGGVFLYGAGDFGEYNDVAWDLISNLLGAMPAAWAAMRYYGR